jgi:excisionase family DNA binding protein
VVSFPKSPRPAMVLRELRRIQRARRQTQTLASVQIGSEETGLSQKTIRRYISTGRIRGYRLGPKLIPIDLNELDELLRPIPAADGSDR